MKIYLDTNAWVRPFEQGNTIVNLQKIAMDKLLEQNFDIFSSKFQLQQFGRLIRTELNLDRKLNFQYARDLCEYTCPNSIKIHTYVKRESDQLLQQTMMNDNEDAIHIVIAWLRGAKYFITADDELYDTKKFIIERSLQRISPIPGMTPENLQILDPINFKRIMGF